MAHVTDEHTHSHIRSQWKSYHKIFMGHEMNLDGLMENSCPMKV